MKTKNKDNWITRKEDLDTRMEYTITVMKLVTTKYRKKIAFIIDSKDEMVDLFAPKRFDSKAADFENKLKILDKGMILKVIERKWKDDDNYLDTDIELSTKN